jgi:uncharacterized membrane protein
MKALTALTLVAGGIGALVMARRATEVVAGNLEARSIAGALIETDTFEEVARSKTINSKLPEVYGFVRDMSMLPRFLPMVKLVNMVDEKRAIWTVKQGPVSVLLDVDITSGPDDDHVQFSFMHHGTALGACQIWLLSVGPELNQTRVTARLKYHPMLHGLVDRMIRPAMTAELDNYLARLKQLMETGEIATAEMR